MKNNTEIELKLQCADSTVWSEVLASPIWTKWGQAKWQEIMMEAVYLDTPQRALNAQQIAYRVRREGKSYIATVKSGGSSNGGLHERREWNVEVKCPEADISVFKDTDIWPKLQGVAGKEPLAPLFVTTFKRLTLEISTNDGAVIEVAADQGEILAGEKESPILELELELKSGQPSSLLKLGAELTKEYPLLLEWRSKYYRALELAGLVPAQPIAEYAAVQAEALQSIQKILALQPVFSQQGHDVRQFNAMLLEMWAELLG